MTDRLEEIEAALAATTPGQWTKLEAHDAYVPIKLYVAGDGDGVSVDSGPEESSDHLFIIAAHNDYVPWLIGALKGERILHGISKAINDLASEESHV